MHFDARYREEIVLPSGDRARLRLIRPDDKQKLAEGFQRLSPQSRYLRFFSHRESLGEAELAYLTEVDQDHHFALGAVRLDETGGEHDGLGIARFVRLEDRPETAEAAVAVADYIAGQGLGRLLMQRLLAAATERGVQRFRCEVLSENDQARALIQSLAIGGELKYEGSGLVSIEWPLPPPDEPLAKDNPLFRLLQSAAAGLVVVQRWIERAVGTSPSSQERGDARRDRLGVGGEKEMPAARNHLERGVGEEAGHDPRVDEPHDRVVVGRKDEDR